MYLEYFDVTYTSLSASVTTKLQLNQFCTNQLRNGRTLRLLSLKASIDNAAQMIEIEEIMSGLSGLRNASMNSIELSQIEL